MSEDKKLGCPMCGKAMGIVTIADLTYVSFCVNCRLTIQSADVEALRAELKKAVRRLYAAETVECFRRRLMAEVDTVECFRQRLMAEVDDVFRALQSE